MLVSNLICSRFTQLWAALLSIFALWDLEEYDQAGIVGSVWPDGMEQGRRSLELSP
jgi:hypothetical protein